MEKVRVCFLCKKEIAPKDNYCRLTDYAKGIFFTEQFYHSVCYSNQIRGMNPQQKVAMSLLSKANKLLNKIGGNDEPDKVYQISNE